jgi:pyruvate-formate lyase-activating enzyme
MMQKSSEKDVEKAYWSEMPAKFIELPPKIAFTIDRAGCHLVCVHCFLRSAATID